MFDCCMCCEVDYSHNTKQEDNDSVSQMLVKGPWMRHREGPKRRVWHLGKCKHSRSLPEITEEIDTSLMSLQNIWRYLIEQQAVSLA